MRQAEETLKQLETEIQSVMSATDDKLLNEYRKLRSVRGGLAVVPVREGTCTGCRLALPPQLYADVRKKEKLFTCSHCHRFLYWSQPSVSTQTPA